MIKAEEVSKMYRLGLIGSATIQDDLKRTWNRWRGKDDPFLKVGQENSRDTAGGDYVWALKDINFEVNEGEVLGIIGRNGAGKSTLLKLLSKVTKPTTGVIKTRGRLASLLEVGTGFHPELTGRENIYLNGAILGMKKAEIRAKFDEIVSFSGCERYIDTPVKRYSSGMYVRLAFAVAAHLEPDVLVVDEVLAVGDAEFQAKAIGKMKEVSERQGRTVLFVSHNMDAIANLTSKTLLMDKGTVKFTGETREGINKYLSINVSKELVYKNYKPLELEPKIRQVELMTSFSNNVHQCLDPLKVKVIVETPSRIEGACLSFHIIDGRSSSIVHSWVFDKDIAFCREKGVFELECEIDKLRLYMGKYSLNVYLSEPPGGKVFEQLEYICPFEVKMFKNTRTLFDWKDGACAYLEDFHWNVRRIES
jgi:lipopolysaccharide transport system ATP-binding protein